MNDLEYAAHNYADYGFAVFPLKADKTPYTVHGFIDASKDHDVISKWWEKYPKANVGIATGSISGGLVVIDQDEKNGEHGISTFERWIDENYLMLPKTCRSKTGTGGRHTFFRSSYPVKSRIAWLPGVDVRAEGGYIVAPPSVVNGKSYEWEVPLNEREIVSNEDDEDVEFILSDIVDTSSKSASGESFKVTETISQGGRNDTLYKLACSLQAKGLTDASIRAAVFAANNEQCNPPLLDPEVEKIIASALTKEKGTAEKQKKQLKSHEQEVTPDLLDMPTLNDIEEEQQEWLISGYIPKGCVTLMCSDGGIGKTGLWCSMLADMTRGEKTILEDIPDGIDLGAKNVMYFSKEDSTKKILRKRIREAGGDLKKFRCFDLDDDRINQITYESDLLEKLIEKYTPDICVFDTLQTFLPEGTNMAERKAMRDALNPLNKLGARFGTAFLLIMHTNKSSNAGRQRMADSSDIWDLGRSALMAGRTKDKDILYLSHEKSNYGKLQKTVLFSMSDCGIPIFRGWSDKKDKDFILESQTVFATPKKDEAKSFIIEQLESKDGKVSMRDLEKDALAVGISKSTLGEAKTELKADKKVKFVSTGYGNTKEWFLLQVKNDPE